MQLLQIKRAGTLVIVSILMIAFTNVSAQNAGTLDPAFGVAGLVTTSVGTGHTWGYTMMLQNDNKIIVAGNSMFNGYVANTLVRYLADGGIDSSFGNNGIVLTQTGLVSSVTSLALQSNNKIVASGYTFLNDSTIYFTVLRYNADGTSDASFGNAGVVLVDVENSSYTYNVAINAIGKIIISGYSKLNNNMGVALVQLNTDGSLDTSFGNGGLSIHHFTESADVEAWAMAMQADGKIVTTGLIYDNILEYNKIAVIRFNTDGSLDPSFATGGIAKISVSSGSANHDDFANAIAIQPDGKIIIAGDSYISPITHFALLRLTSTGELDTTFGLGGIALTDIGNAENSAYGVTVQADGKIVAVGECRDNIVSGGGNFAMARYNNDGSPDMTFGNGGKVMTDFGGADDYAYCVKELTDGKLIVSGIAKNGDYYNFALARYVGTSVAVPEFPLEENMQLFPNPAADYIMMPGVKNATIEIFNIHGQVVKSLKILNTNAAIDVSALSTGVYYVKVKDDKSAFKGKQEHGVIKFIKL